MFPLISYHNLMILMQMQLPSRAVEVLFWEISPITKNGTCSQQKPTSFYLKGIHIFHPFLGIGILALSCFAELEMNCCVVGQRYSACIPIVHSWKPNANKGIQAIECNGKNFLSFSLIYNVIWISICCFWLDVNVDSLLYPKYITQNWKENPGE